MGEQTATIDRGRRASDQRVDKKPVSKTDSIRTISRRRLLGAAAVGTATAVTGATIDAAVQSGLAGKFAKKAAEKVGSAIREALRPKPTDVYSGDITIEMRYAKIYGQPRITNPYNGDVSPRNVNAFNDKKYTQERFMIVGNGRIVGEKEKFLELRVDDGNPTGQYYGYLSLGEEQTAFVERPDPNRFIGIKSVQGDNLILNNGSTFNKYQVNITRFR